MLSQITPVLLTLNEGANIGRTLARLKWAQDIVIVDSYSTDDTIAIANAYPQVRIFQRQFDSHAAQWNYALQSTGLAAEWVLALDADYVLSDALVQELRGLKPEQDVVGYLTHFEYCIYGKPLRGSVYPPVITLFRRGKGSYVQDGHTQRLRVTGRVGTLRGPIQHDDRKPVADWLAAQNRYMSLEAAKLSEKTRFGLVDRIRKIYLSPLLMLFYCACWKGNILDGKAGLYYIYQRTLAELLLSLQLLQREFHRQVTEPQSCQGQPDSK